MKNIYCDKVILFYTNQCNASCRHCFISPLQEDGKCIMSERILERAIKLTQLFNAHRIVFSGGEPALYLRNIFSSFSRVSIPSHMRFTLCTNGYWAVNECNRRKILMDLRRNSFDVLDISTDSFHQEFIDLESAIVPLINNALEMGFRVSVNVCYTELIREAYTISTLAFLLKDKGSLHIRSVSNFGNAKKNNLVLGSGVNGKLECQVAGELCIRYDGQVFICCGPPLVYNISEFCLGDILSGIEEVRIAYENNKLIAAMHKGIWDKIINPKGIDCLENNSLCCRCMDFMDD